MISYFSFIIIINLLIFYFYEPIAKLYNVFDYPDYERKIHIHPVPLLGGFFLLINLGLILLLNYYFILIFDNSYFPSIKSLYFFFLTIFFFFLIGLIDDKFKLNANLKLTITTLSIIISLYFDKDILLNSLNFSFNNKIIYLGNFNYFITVLCFLLFINAFNMLDGVNGQASCYAIFIFIVFILKGILVLFFLTLLLVLVFFLFLNFKNKSYLGETGSLVISYIVSYTFIKNYNIVHNFSSDEIFLIMCIPGYDLRRLAIQRIALKKHPFSGDNLHIHHLLLKKWGFLKTFFTIQLLLVFPYLSYYLIDIFFISLILSLLTYFLTFYYFYYRSR
jgi:UDP-N-acetylmuramyl pentapeptide phosphotransferase/UDP-N-acetylglucosamine-1-phosphate transferase